MPADGQMPPQEGQQGIVWGRHHVTYTLRVEPLHERLSSLFCDARTRSHTFWGQHKDAKGSAVNFVMKAPDHILAEGRTWVQKVQQWILWWKHQITYFLMAEHGCKRFSSGFCDESTRSHTGWGQNMGGKGSAVDFVMQGLDRIPSDGRTWVQKVQHWILWWKHQITYSLGTEHGAKGSAVDFVMKAPNHILPESRNGCKRFSSGFCDESTRSHTCWGWNNGAKGSAVDFIMKAPDHILAESRTWVQKVQQWTLWWKHQITYKLMAEHGYKRFSSGFCEESISLHTRWGQNMGAKSSAVDFLMKAPDHIFAKGRTWVQKVQQWILWWKYQITYFLRAEHGCKRFSSRFCDKSRGSHTCWGWNNGAKGSAVDFVMKAPDHILPESMNRPPEGQVVLQCRG